jgi:hypothetical protein
MQGAMNRLSIAFGVVGAIAFGSVGCWRAYDGWVMLTAYNRFESLAQHLSIQKEFENVLDVIHKDWITTTSAPGELNPFAHYQLRSSIDGVVGFYLDRSTKTITSIELATGESLSRTPRPPLVDFVALPICVLIGFLIPWIGVRAFFGYSFSNNNWMF